jgi:AMMECR1 domain-containing protein
MKAKAKGHIYENEEARIRYEDLYSKNWYVQNRLDVSVRPNLKGQYRTVNRAEKRRQAEAKMSKNALMVNKYLDKKMTVPQIAEEMFSTENFVKNIIKKYQLPV